MLSMNCWKLSLSTTSHVENFFENFSDEEGRFLPLGRGCHSVGEIILKMPQTQLEVLSIINQILHYAKNSTQLNITTTIQWSLDYNHNPPTPCTGPTYGIQFNRGTHANTGRHRKWEQQNSIKYHAIIQVLLTRVCFSFVPHCIFQASGGLTSVPHCTVLQAQRVKLSIFDGFTLISSKL